MKKEFILIVLEGCFVFSVFSQNPPQDKNWEEVFKDSFNTFYTGRWYREHNLVKGDYKPNEGKFDEDPHIYYMDNVYTANGKLVLEAKRLTDSLPCPKGSANCQYGGWHKYTSGAIVSNNKYKYGYFETYAQLPSGTSFFPAFWLWNANDTPPNCFYNEIDIMEADGCDPNWVSSNFQATFNCLQKKRNAIHHTCNYTDGSYHWYGVEWDSDKIIWYVDRMSVRQISNNLWGIGIQNPLSIIINLSLFPPTWGKCPLNDALLPNYMYVDQANHYKLKYECDAVVNEIPDYDEDIFNYAVKKSISLSSVSSLESGENVSLRATDFIELKSGFEVPEGAELYLDINPCE